MCPKKQKNLFIKERLLLAYSSPPPPRVRAIAYAQERGRDSVFQAAPHARVARALACVSRARAARLCSRACRVRACPRACPCALSLSAPSACVRVRASALRVLECVCERLCALRVLLCVCASEPIRVLECMCERLCALRVLVCRCASARARHTCVTRACHEPVLHRAAYHTTTLVRVRMRVWCAGRRSMHECGAPVRLRARVREVAVG